MQIRYIVLVAFGIGARATAAGSIDAQSTDKKCKEWRDQTVAVGGAVVGGGQDKLFMEGGPLLQIVNSRGDGSVTGGFLRVSGETHFPVNFGLSGVLNEQVPAGVRSRTVSLAMYRKQGDNTATSVRVRVQWCTGRDLDAEREQRQTEADREQAEAKRQEVEVESRRQEEVARQEAQRLAVERQRAEPKRTQGERPSDSPPLIPQENAGLASIQQQMAGAKQQFQKASSELLNLFQERSAERNAREQRAAVFEQHRQDFIRLWEPVVVQVEAFRADEYYHPWQGYMVRLSRKQQLPESENFIAVASPDGYLKQLKADAPGTGIEDRWWTNDVMENTQKYLDDFRREYEAFMTFKSSYTGKPVIPAGISQQCPQGYVGGSEGTGNLICTRADRPDR